jgi:hypothetical protein
MDLLNLFFSKDLVVSCMFLNENGEHVEGYNYRGLVVVIRVVRGWRYQDKDFLSSHE